MITQPVIEKISLPFHPKLECCEFLPVGDQGLHARFAWKSDDGMQMVGHEQTDAAMPEQLLMVIRHGCENVVANTSLAKLISARWQTFDGDEKRAALRHPIGGRCAAVFYGRAGTWENGIEIRCREKPLGWAGSPLPAGVWFVTDAMRVE
jgi:hypothetical protein